MPLEAERETPLPKDNEKVVTICTDAKSVFTPQRYCTEISKQILKYNNELT